MCAALIAAYIRNSSIKIPVYSRLCEIDARRATRSQQYHRRLCFFIDFATVTYLPFTCVCVCVFSFLCFFGSICVSSDSSMLRCGKLDNGDVFFRMNVNVKYYNESHAYRFRLNLLNLLNVIFIRAELLLLKHKVSTGRRQSWSCCCRDKNNNLHFSIYEKFMNNGRQPRTYLGAVQTRSVCSQRLEKISSIGRNCS